MKNLAVRWAPAAFLLLAVSGAGEVARGDDFQPAGRWVLVNDWGLPLEKAIFDVTPNDHGFDVRLIDARGKRGTAEVKNFACRNGHVTFTLVRERAGEMAFEGTLAVEGRYAGQMLGVTRGTYLDPARLKRTTADQLAEIQQPPYRKQLDDAWDTADKREQAAKLLEVIRQHPGPETNVIFKHVLASAESADLTEGQVRDLNRLWFAAAEPYGPAFLAVSRLSVLRPLQGQKKFASLAFDVAEQARKDLDNLSSAKHRSSLFHFLAGAAELSGHGDAAATARARADEIDARLDAYYRAKVPHFKVDASAGRKRPEENRTVLLELFTCALCAPCVAADVACDALDSAFKTSELIVLQHHLHIPGADPLTNPSTLAREKYYALRGVPRAYFNGEEYPSGGGNMAAAEAKYHEYRQRIEPLLGGKRLADIDLSVKRSSDHLAIRVVADATALSRQLTVNQENGRPSTDPPLRLRLALTEGSVRYDGGNGVRLNHHVVRDFPGGTNGTLLRNGRTELNLAVELGQVRGQLLEYTHSIATRLAVVCPGPLPQPELKRLTLVAFIQDDATKHILHAVCVLVPDE